MHRLKALLTIPYSANRVYGLDVLRAFAIFFILLGHGSLFLSGKALEITQYLLFDGVTIFFVLSGFLIGGIWFKTIEKNKITGGLVFNFWIRRWFRTLPAYYLVLTILSFIHLYFVKDIVSSVIPPFYLFIQNFNQPHPWFFAEAWSLSIEEWFYIFLPLVFIPFLLFMKLSVKKSAIIIVATVITGFIVYRWFRYHQVPVTTIFEWDDYFRRQVVTRLDSIMYGVLGAFVFQYYPNLWKENSKLFLILGVILHLLGRFYFSSLTETFFYDAVFSFSVTSLATLFLLPYLSGIQKSIGLFSRWITFISVISYSIYLVNSSVMHILLAYREEFIKIIPSSLLELTTYLLFWIVTLCLSFLLYRLIEYPFMKLREHSFFVNRF